MPCSGCSNAVKKVLSEAEGVDSFDVNLDDQLVVVKTSVLSKEQVLDTVKKSGK